MAKRKSAFIFVGLSQEKTNFLRKNFVFHISNVSRSLL
jgi:hypothetical protein